MCVNVICRVNVRASRERERTVAPAQGLDPAKAIVHLKEEIAAGYTDRLPLPSPSPRAVLAYRNPPAVSPWQRLDDGTRVVPWQQSQQSEESSIHYMSCPLGVARCVPHSERSFWSIQMFLAACSRAGRDRCCPWRRCFCQCWREVPPLPLVLATVSCKLVV